MQYQQQRKRRANDEQPHERSGGGWWGGVGGGRGGQPGKNPFCGEPAPKRLEKLKFNRLIRRNGPLCPLHGAAAPGRRVIPTNEEDGCGVRHDARRRFSGEFFRWIELGSSEGPPALLVLYAHTAWLGNLTLYRHPPKPHRFGLIRSTGGRGRSESIRDRGAPTRSGHATLDLSLDTPTHTSQTHTKRASSGGRRRGRLLPLLPLPLLAIQKSRPLSE